MSDTEATVTLVNTDQLRPRRVLLQAGARLVSASLGSGTWRWGTVARGGDRHGCGARLALTMKRFANAPSVAFPSGL